VPFTRGVGEPLISVFALCVVLAGSKAVPKRVGNYELLK
jgi:hypothetical protein